MYANIAVPAPLHKLFTYRIPEALKAQTVPGMRAVVSFRKRHVIGYIISLTEKAPERGETKEIKEITDLPDSEPLFRPKFLKLVQWIADYYCAPIGDVCKATLPNAFSKLPKRTIAKTLRKTEIAYDKSNTAVGLQLKEEQMSAFEQLKKIIGPPSFSATLLHGITGSGKTEIYLRLIADVLKKGGETIFLVPEIGLTPQLLSRVRERFGKLVSIYHSGLSDSIRLNEWEKMRRGKTKIVVGTRSAVFAPFPNLGLIIVDEEHDTSYKQEESPRYNGRDTAVMRAKLEEIPVVLGSATPSIESFYNAKTKKYHYIHLEKRATGAELPKVELIDMCAARNGKRHQNISRALITEISKSLRDKHQVMLFLNRRGYAPFVLCKDCGFTPTCPNCEITLTYHLQNRSLVCHYCNFKIRAPDICEKCGGIDIKPLGLGTQKIEKELSELFPGARIARLDRDIAGKKNAVRDILKKMKNGLIDILVGTQMITKGHDFSNVTLVGIIDSDISLNIPDFRASERTFQLLTQVAGRAGRGEHPGKVLIQTFSPHQPPIQCAKEHDYFSFYDMEIKQRKSCEYPPFTRIANITLKGNNEKKVSEYSEVLGRHLNSLKTKGLKEELTILGPAPAVLKKISGKYRWQILLKGKKVSVLSSVLKEAIKFSEKNAPSGVNVIIDVDPANTL